MKYFHSHVVETPTKTSHFTPSLQGTQRFDKKPPSSYFKHKTDLLTRAVQFIYSEIPS